MRNHIKKIFGVTIFISAITALFVWTLLWSTKAEVWYAGMHDAEHESNGPCHCYERLITADGNLN